VSGEQPEQLLPNVPGGAEDADGHQCMIIHYYEKLCSPACHRKPQLAHAKFSFLRSAMNLGWPCSVVNRKEPLTL